MSESVKGLSPEQYRAILAESIKTAGNMLINNAESIVGDMNSLVGITIKFDFDSESGNIPEMTVTKSHYPEYKEMTELLEKHNRIIEGSKKFTCRELLQKEHPEKMNHNSPGGCEGCPNQYGYLDPRYLPCRDEGPYNKLICSRCWDLIADAYYEKPKTNDKNSCDFLDPTSFLDKED